MLITIYFYSHISNIFIFISNNSTNEHVVSKKSYTPINPNSTPQPTQIQQYNSSVLVQFLSALGTTDTNYNQSVPIIAAQCMDLLKNMPEPNDQLNAIQQRDALRESNECPSNNYSSKTIIDRTHKRLVKLQGDRIKQIETVRIEIKKWLTKSDKNRRTSFKHKIPRDFSLRFSSPIKTPKQINKYKRKETNM